MKANGAITVARIHSALGKHATAADMVKKDKNSERDGSGGDSSRKSLFGWRRQSEGTPLPPLATALRQLRQHILDAHGVGVAAFVERTQAIAALARDSGEPESSAILLKLAAIAELGRDRDVRPILLDLLDEAHWALRPPEEGA